MADGVAVGVVPGVLPVVLPDVLPVVGDGVVPEGGAVVPDVAPGIEPGSVPVLSVGDRVLSARTTAAESAVALVEEVRLRATRYHTTASTTISKRTSGQMLR
ncbi:MAG: hypothetical protein JWM95_1882 [Gemmatimonadetes bacterium]|nr:hypothetical protein [Gemmatimonadota bacterium]